MQQQGDPHENCMNPMKLHVASRRRAALWGAFCGTHPQHAAQDNAWPLATSCATWHAVQGTV